jgi:L-cysteine:1D-myo-inositol 2-amino-2-deoxy-alpha-D-glucopyranoside ligase
MSARGLHLYNTASRGFESIDDERVGVYVCGVTPYDTTHLGHAFTYTAFDVLIRYLRFLGREVTYVRNVTDIDDDILLRARSTEMDWRELGNGQFAKFREDMRRLNNLEPEFEPRATDHILEIIEITEALLAKGVAYHAEANVYFEVAKRPTFGSLAGLDYPAQLALANERGNFPGDPNKRDALDFVLWQAKKEGEPSWSSPWGEGRPGWHIECSAMSTKHLGNTVTIHGGGDDLVFPHHEAEIAQTESVTGQQFVKHWMHTGMVFYGQHKMSKSLGNMVFVSDLLDSGPPDALRLLLLSHHYRGSWDFEEAKLGRAQELCRTLSDSLSGAGEATAAEIEANGSEALGAMADDLNTPRAIEAIEVLAGQRDPVARRVARTLANRLLGLRLEP